MALYSLHARRFPSSLSKIIFWTNFCNPLVIIRIPYDADYIIDDLKLETTRFLLTPENEKEYHESR